MAKQIRSVRCRVHLHPAAYAAGSPVPELTPVFLEWGRFSRKEVNGASPPLDSETIRVK